MDQLAVVCAYGRLIQILEPVDVAHLARVTGMEELRIILAISRLLQAGFLDPADVPSVSMTVILDRSNGPLAHG